jgi:1,4-alpha-glucan branching enzyme
MTAQLTPSAPLLLTDAHTHAPSHARSRLTAWTPHSKTHPRPRLQTPAHASHTDTWLITVADTQAQELWLSGDFNNWRIPGLRMIKTKSGNFEATLDLPPTISQFACYEFQPARGFRRIPSDKIQCFLIRQSHA